MRRLSRIRLPLPVVTVFILLAVAVLPVAAAPVTQPDAPPGFDLDGFLAAIDDYIPNAAWLIGTIALNFALAVAGAIRQRDFEFKRIADWLTGQLIPFTISYVAISLLGDRVAGLEMLGPVVFTAIEGSLIARIIVNLERVGVPVPPALVEWMERSDPGPA